MHLRVSANTTHRENLRLLNNNDYKKYSAMMQRLNNLIAKANKLHDKVEQAQENYKLGEARKLENQFWDIDDKIEELLVKINDLTDQAFDKHMAKVA